MSLSALVSLSGHSFLSFCLVCLCIYLLGLSVGLAAWSVCLACPILSVWSACYLVSNRVNLLSWLMWTWTWSFYLVIWDSSTAVWLTDVVLNSGLRVGCYGVSMRSFGWHDKAQTRLFGRVVLVCIMPVGWHDKVQTRFCFFWPSCVGLNNAIWLTCPLGSSTSFWFNYVELPRSFRVGFYGFKWDRLVSYVGLKRGRLTWTGEIWMKLYSWLISSTNMGGFVESSGLWMDRFAG